MSEPEIEGVILDSSEIMSNDICPSCGYTKNEPPGPGCTALVWHGIITGCPITQEITPE